MNSISSILLRQQIFFWQIISEIVFSLIKYALGTAK